MKEVFSWKPLALAILFALAASLFLKVIQERDSRLDLSFPQPSVSSVVLFVEPDDGVEPIITAIRSAKRSIDLACYLFSEDWIIEELIDAHRHGIKIRVILEREPYGGSPVNYRTRKELVDAGILFKWAPPAFVLSHEKVIVIDRAKALIMTLNLCRSAFTRNREYGVIIEDPHIVREISRIFEADWQGRRYRSKEPNLVVSPCNSRLKLTAMIARSRRKIWLQQLLLEDRKIIDALSEAARRGVEVKVLLASREGVEDPFAKEGLSSAGVMVRFQYDPYLHAKAIDCDGEVLFIGSVNLSSPSLDLNREIGIILTDRGIISEWEETFLKDWAEGR